MAGRAPWALAAVLGAGAVAVLAVAVISSVDEDEAAGRDAPIAVVEVPERGAAEETSGAAVGDDADGPPESAPPAMPAATGTADPPPGERLPVTDPALTEKGSTGPLPKVADDGSRPWQTYARPFDGRDDRPRVAVIVTDLGLGAKATRTAIAALPGAMTLAFSPYAADIDGWARQARERGHEILLALPMESGAFPYRDPGPAALLASLPPEDNVGRLRGVLGRTSGYVGVISASETPLEADADGIRPILEEIRQRGLMYVDGHRLEVDVVATIAAELGLPQVVVNLVIDEEPTGAAIDLALARLETIASERAVAVGLARPYPVSIKRLAAWAGEVERRNLVLAPVSAAAGRQLGP